MKNLFRETIVYMFVVIVVITTLLLSVTMCYHHNSDFYCWVNHHKIYEAYVGDFIAERSTTDGQMVAEYVDDSNDLHVFVPFNSILADTVYVSTYCPICDCEVTDQPNVTCVLSILCMLTAEIAGFTTYTGMRFILPKHPYIRLVERKPA